MVDEDSFVVQMPTSAGKTLVAELSILAALTLREGGHCLYIAPYRALVNEIENNLADTLGAVGYRVSNLIGGFEFDTFQKFLATEADVLVATPEKVELLLRTHPEYFENLSVIVVDEGHIVDEGIPLPGELSAGKTLLEALEERGTLGRGPLLEFLVTRLKHKLPQARFVFLSAVMPEVNAGDFLKWLSKRNQAPLRISPEARPSRQVIAKFEWKRLNGELEYLRGLPTLPDGKNPFVPYFLQRQQYLTGDYTPTGRSEKRNWPDQTNKAQTTAMLAVKFAKTGPVLVFCAQPLHARQVIDNIVTSLKYLETSNALPTDKLKYDSRPDLQSFQLAQEWLGENHPLTIALHYHVGLHYGPLPDLIRQAIEDEFREDKIQILISTNTLGQGVNLPVKTAIIYSLERVQGAGERIPVKKRDFWNICGRAGRAGKETEGLVVFVIVSDRDRRLLRDYINEANLEEVNSALFKLLEALIQKRIDQDQVVEYLDSHVLAILVEEVVDTQDEAAIENWLGTSLVGVQAQRKGVELTSLANAIKNASSKVISSIPDRALRQVFSSTGLRVTSCQHLEIVADEFLRAINIDVLELERNNGQCDYTLLEAAFQACQNLPEMRLKPGVDYHGPHDEIEIVREWVTGRSIREIRSRFWDHIQIEGFSEYIADRVTYKLPWGFNGFLRIIAFKLRTEYEGLPIAWQHLPSMMKFGVNNVIACWASSLGVSSRSLALQLSEKYRPPNGLVFPEFIGWIVNLPAEFVFQELEGLEFEKRQLLHSIQQIIYDRDHLEFVRNPKMELISPIRGIPYGGRRKVASQVRTGDHLKLELDLENLYDSYAVRVLYDEKQIGFIQRDKARIVSREIQLGREFLAQVSNVQPGTDEYPFPWINVTIRFK